MSKRKRSSLEVRLRDLPCAPLDALDTTVAAALERADALVAALPAGLAEAKEATDAARDSTFPFLDGAPSCGLQHAAAYSAASVLWAACLLEEANGATSASAAYTAAQAALRALDLAMLRGGVEKWSAVAEPLVRSATLHLEHVEAVSAPICAAPSAAKAWEEQCPHFTANGHAIPRVDARSLGVEEFRARFMEPPSAAAACVDTPRPVVLTHALDAWPAFGKWSFASLKETHGHRLVPVETYASRDASTTYLSASWAQRVMPLAEYVDRYVLHARDGALSAASGGCSNDAGDGDVGGDGEDGGDDAARGYLAQHPLLDQIPMLRDEIRTPCFCEALTAEDQAAPAACEVRLKPIVSAWLGPAGTVSPLHTDPFHNLLGQVVGHKYVRLFAAGETPKLYPRSGALCNNSYVDLDTPNPTEQPLVADASFAHCVLGPGELLYIPRHFWHYVRSLEPSASVSFWWGARMALTLSDEGGVEATY